MIQPKPVTIPTQDGTERQYVLTKFDAIAGREIISQWPISALPKVGDYGVNEATMLKMMAFVGAQPADGGEPIMLRTKALVVNHVPDWETLARLEKAMIEYNCSFFGKGVNSDFWMGLMQKAQPLISQMLTGLQEQSSPVDKQPFTN